MVSNRMRTFLFMPDYLHHYELKPETIPDAFDSLYKNKRNCVLVEVDGESINILEVVNPSKDLRYLSDPKKIEQIVNKFKQYCLEEA